MSKEWKPLKIFYGPWLLVHGAVTYLPISWDHQLNDCPVSSCTFQFLVRLVRRTAGMLGLQTGGLSGSSVTQKGKCPGSQGSWKIQSQPAWGKGHYGCLPAGQPVKNRREAPGSCPSRKHRHSANAVSLWIWEPQGIRWYWMWYRGRKLDDLAVPPGFVISIENWDQPLGFVS